MQNVHLLMQWRPEVISQLSLIALLPAQCSLHAASTHGLQHRQDLCEWKISSCRPSLFIFNGKQSAVQNLKIRGNISAHETQLKANTSQALGHMPVGPTAREPEGGRLPLPGQPQQIPRPCLKIRGLGEVAR